MVAPIRILSKELIQGINQGQRPPPIDPFWSNLQIIWIISVATLHPAVQHTSPGSGSLRVILSLYDTLKHR